MRFYDVTKPPFRVYGIWGIEGAGEYRRIPSALADRLGGMIPELCCNTSGGRVRFRTDAKELSVRVKLADPVLFAHFSVQGMCGVDLYEKVGNAYALRCPFVPPAEGDTYELFAALSGEMREYMLYLPTYASPLSVEIGLPEEAEVRPAPEYSRPPVGFYGSSITQGACASRAGMCYHSIATRALDVDMLNFGFSGHAKGEPEIAEFIAEREMSAFVLDYDYNAPDAAHLARTHGNFYRIIRDRNPQLPVLLLSACSFGFEPDAAERRGIVRETYERARRAGEPVRFIDGETLFGEDGRGECTVDRLHPNDLGMWRMAERVIPVLREMLEI